VRALGGRLQIHSQRGQGTRLRALVPLPVSADELAPVPADVAAVPQLAGETRR
jgi:chemotaxis protein histidine kinase CheA